MYTVTARELWTCRCDLRSCDADSASASVEAALISPAPGPAGPARPDREVGRQHGQQTSDLVPCDPCLVPGLPGYGIGTLRETPGRAWRPPTAPLTGTIETHYVTVQDPLCVAPQQPVHNISRTLSNRRTFSLDEVEFTQSPSPWLEPDPPGSSVENVRAGHAIPTDSMCDFVRKRPGTRH